MKDFPGGEVISSGGAVLDYKTKPQIYSTNVVIFL